MRRGGAAVLLAVAALGLVALIAEAGSDKRDLAFTLGVVPSIPAAHVAPGKLVCQGPISVAEAFDRVQVKAGTAGALGSPLAISVVTLAGKPLARGRIAGGYRGAAEQSAEVGKVDADQRVSVCLTNAGSAPVDVYGNTAAAAATSQALLNGRRPLPTDLTIVFLRDEPRSVLAGLPDAFDRASLFKAGWVGPWVFWLLTAGIAIGVPILLARALAESEDAP